MAIQTTATSSRRWARPRLVTVILTLVFVALPFRTPPVGAQDASPVAGAAGGTLYTYDSGEAGFFTKTYFYDSGSEVVAFDAQFTPALAEQAIASLREQSDNPITYLVITHPNPDKFNGATAFQDEGAAVIASEATAAAIPDVHEYKKAGFVGMGMFTEETYPRQAAVDETFTGAHTLELGDGKTVELSELSEPGVSSTQTVAFIPELNGLIVGDLVHHKLHAWLEGGIVNGQATPTLDGWIADLQELETTFTGDPEPTVYGGRGEPAPLSTTVAEQIAYLETADQIVTDYVAGLEDRASELSGPDAGQHYAAVQTELAEAFPGYAFPDMISFSIYGLVNSKL
jgi:glyoxylase-like metal-dependent hydrolase (beta-lactamase superfamily II)